MGMSRLSVALGLVFTLLSAVAGAQQSDVQALLQECRARQVDRWNGVTHYVVDQSMMGNRVTLAYERFEAPGPDGKLYPGFRPLRQDSPYSTGDLALYSEGARRVGTGLSDEMAKAGFPAGMLGGAGADPWVSTDPEVMMGGAAAFVDAAAEAQEQNAHERKAAVAEASESMSQLAEIAPQFRLVGTEAVQGRSARHLQARGLQRRLASEGDAQMVIDDVDLWIDSQECVPLRLTMAGTMTAQGQSRPLTIERLDSDYRNVAGSNMYEPFKQVMRMKGVMSPEQQGEMAKAQAQLAEMEQRLAQLPPAQRDMIMRQMGPQMATMKSMASGGAFEVAIEVHSILVNPDPAALQASATGVAGLNGAAAAFQPGGSTTTATPTGAPAPATAAQPGPGKTAQQACLEEKIRKQQAAQKKKQGMGKLLGAMGRVAGQFGGAELARAANDAMTAQATADDLAAAARDLGITEDEIATCIQAR